MGNLSIKNRKGRLGRKLSLYTSNKIKTSELKAEKEEEEKDQNLDLLLSLENKETIIDLLKEIFDCFQKDQNISSWNINHKFDFIFIKFFLGDKEYNLNIWWQEKFSKDQKTNISFQNDRNITITVIKNTSKREVMNIITGIVMRRVAGLDAENSLIQLLDKVILGSKIFAKIVPATSWENKKDHADFFISYRVSNKKTRLIPIDCKLNRKSQIDAIENNGYEYPSINLTKVKDYLGKGKKDELLQKIKMLCDDYLSSKDIYEKQIHI